jgi:UDP-N-acetyl-D-mannosaminuronic acid dehydrogenase
MASQDQHVCILGMGFVGLTLAVVMAECGFQVVGVEINPDTIKKLESGNAHFFEVGLQSRLSRQLANGSLRFVSRLTAESAAGCSLFILTVGTPLDKGGDPRMDMVERATGEVADAMREGSLVILRSTVRLGTTRKVVKPILDQSGKSYQLAYCPERTIEGNALAELRMLPQIVGGMSGDDAWRAAAVFQHMTPTTIRVSTLETAELIKLLDNSYRDLFFAFGNEVALLCEAAGLDAIEVIGAGKTGYARTNIAMPGFVGGPCLEKDPHILEHAMKDFGFRPELISTGRRLNEELPGWVVRSLSKMLAGVGGKKKIAICGMAFKGRPETDDLRGTPSTLLVDAMRETFPDAEIVGQDFAVAPAAIAELGVPSATIDEAFTDAHAVVIANNNSKYEWLDLDGLMATMAKPAVIYDCWSVLQLKPEDAPEGVRYVRLGSVNAALAKEMQACIS